MGTDTEVKEDMVTGMEDMATDMDTVLVATNQDQVVIVSVTSTVSS